MLKHCAHEYKYGLCDHPWLPHSWRLHKGKGKHRSTETDSRKAKAQCFLQSGGQSDAQKAWLPLCFRYLKHETKKNKTKSLFARTWQKTNLPSEY